MNVLRLITDFIKMSKVWFLSMEFYGAWQKVAKITIKFFQLCSIKIKGNHAPCDITCNHSMDLAIIALVHACS